MRYLFTFILASFFASLALAGPSTQPVHDPHFRDLGPQISSSLLQGSTFTKDPSGKLLACAVVRGDPGKLVVYDAATGQLLHKFPLDGAHGAWNACTATDGSVYVGTDSNGHLYRYIPGENLVHDIGQAIDTWVWDVTPGKDGEVFISTYPQALAVRYHPKDGFSDVGHGSLVKGENYARSITYHAPTDTLYVGIGSHAHLVQLNPRTGEKKDITTPELKGKDFAYTVDALGNYLVVHPLPGDGNLVYDIKSLKLVGQMPVSSILHCTTKSPTASTLYYCSSDNKLMAWNPETPDKESVAVADISSINAFMWLSSDPSSPSLLCFNKYGKVYTLPFTGSGPVKPTSISYEMPLEATILQSIVAGADGRIWSGGYLSGSVAAYDPLTGKSQQFGDIGQSEHIGVLDKTIYFGTYPGAVLVAYDTTKPWDVKKGNPRKYAELEAQGQSRPYAMLGVPEFNAVFTGTVAEYGHLDGLLARYDVASDKLTTFKEVVHNQSIVSLAWCKGVVVGGTSIKGGLGQEPTEKEAKLFIFDPKTNQKVFEVVPVPGKTTITGLFVGPDRNVWGSANGTLFVFDPALKQVVSRHELIPNYPNIPDWRDAYFASTKDGTLYASLGGKLYRLNPSTFQIAPVANGPSGLHHLALDDRDRLYFIAEDTRLWQYTP